MLADGSIPVARSGPVQGSGGGMHVGIVAMDSRLADIARDDIVGAPMLFLDGNIKSVLPALAARREHRHAMVCVLSAGAGEELEDRLEGLNVEMAA